MNLEFEKLLKRVGGASQLARLLSTDGKTITRHVIYEWHGRVPEAWLETFDLKFNIAPWKLCPDLYRPRVRFKRHKVSNHRD